MSFWVFMLVVSLTFGCTWVILSCLWAASEADRKSEKEEENDKGE